MDGSFTNSGFCAVWVWFVSSDCGGSSEAL